MLTRQSLRFTPDPASDGFTLEQRLVNRSSSSVGIWLKVIGFLLLGNLLVNGFSFFNLAGGHLPDLLLWMLFSVSATGTTHANFISKTVVAFDPTKPLQLSDDLQRLYDRLDSQIKENKDRFGIKETILVIDDDALAELKRAEILHIALSRQQPKFNVVMQLLANRYGSITIISPAEARAKYTPDSEQNNLIAIVNSGLSDEMIAFLAEKPRGTKAFNYDSYWEGLNRREKCADFWISAPRWVFIYGCPSLVLIQQGITTTISTLLKIPNFSNIHWGLKIGSILASGILVSWARTSINNRLKGDKAVAEAKALAFTVSKLFLSCRKRPAITDGSEQKESKTNNSPTMTLQVNHAVAIATILIALASVGLTVYYNYATAKFYSPSQANELLISQLNGIPGIENTPQTLIDIGEVIQYLQNNVLYPLQIISAVVLSFLTSCKSTLDKVLNWLFKPPAADAKSFCEKPFSEKAFAISNPIDSATFGVNAAFNSYSINANKALAVLTGLGIFLTSIFWGSDTKNIPKAHAAISCSSCCVSASCCSCCSSNSAPIVFPEMKEPLLEKKFISSELKASDRKDGNGGSNVSDFIADVSAKDTTQRQNVARSGPMIAEVLDEHGEGTGTVVYPLGEEPPPTRLSTSPHNNWARSAVSTVTTDAPAPVVISAPSR